MSMGAWLIVWSSLLIIALPLLVSAFNPPSPVVPPPPRKREKGV